MKTSIRLAVCLFALTLTPAFGQPVAPAPQLPPPGAPNFQQRLQTIINRANQPQDPAPVLTKFDLDFSGGTPAELVKAIQKATGKPLNAIIPTEDADIQLPPLKMNDVVTPQLFTALEAASRKTATVQYLNLPNSYQEFNLDYGFRTADGPISDTSIWYFHAEKPNLPPVISTGKICRFYPLEVFLNRGFTVDDITTAIQTGWKMSGITSPPELNYHKETKLLIAFGEPRELDTISSVLQSLPSSSSTRDEIGNLNEQIRQLSVQVNQLTKKISLPVPAAVPEEKSGK